MKKYAKAVRPGLSFFAVAVLSLVPAMAPAQSAPDSEEFSGFLAEAKSEAAQLQKSKFGLTSINWENSSQR